MSADAALVEMFAALSHPHRLAIARMLLASPEDGIRTGEAATKLDAAPDVVSKAFRILADAGLARKLDLRHYPTAALRGAAGMTGDLEIGLGCEARP